MRWPSDRIDAKHRTTSARSTAAANSLGFHAIFPPMVVAFNGDDPYKLEVWVPVCGAASRPRMKVSGSGGHCRLQVGQVSY